jgi:site-specific recombinase XerD
MTVSDSGDVSGDSQDLVVTRLEQLPAFPMAELEQARSYADASRAASTRRAYESDWRAFNAWCLERGLDSLPADPRVVAVFLSAEAARGCAPLTVGRRLAAIGYMHRRAGFQPPQQKEGAAAIAEVLAGIRRSRISTPVRKAAADADIIWQLLHSITGDRLRDHRDHALIAIGMAAALRRSELVALRIEDVERSKEGLRIRVVRSKTDQEGAGQVIAVPRGRRLKPVALLDAWLQAAGITEGFVFRRFVSKADHLSDQPMDDAGVALVVKRRAAAAGLTAADFSGHSLRSGFLTSAARAGASIWKMQEVSRHKSVQVLSGYVRSAELFDDHAGTDFL